MKILKRFLLGALLACGAASASYNPNYSNSGIIAPPLFYAKNYGALCDVANFTGGTATASSTTYNTGSTILPAASGKLIIIPGAGLNGKPLVTTYTATGSSANITLGVAASTNSSSSTSYAGYAYIASHGSGFVPGDTGLLTSTGSTVAAQVTIQYTGVTAAPTIAAAGSGGVSGSGTVVIAGTSGTAKRRVLGTASLSGGGLSGAIAITSPGLYTTNPSSLSAEPIKAYRGTYGNYVDSGLTGATINLSAAMGVETVTFSHPGSYTSTPSNPVSLASTSGGGSGLTMTVIWQTGGTFSTATDDTSALQSAINAAGVSGGYMVMPPNACGITSGLTNAKSSVVMGTWLGSPQAHADGQQHISGGLSCFAQSPITMLKYAPATGAGAADMTGSGIDGLAFLGNGVCDIGIQGLSVLNGHYDLYTSNFLTAGFDRGSVSGTLNDNYSSQQNTINIYGEQTIASGDILRLGGAVGLGNSSFDIITAHGSIVSGFGIECVNADNETFLNSHVFLNPAGAGSSFQGSGDSGGTCRDNKFFGFSGNGGMYFAGLESQATPTTANYIAAGPDSTNNDPLPKIGPGAQVYSARGTGYIYGENGVNSVFVDADTNIPSALASSAAYGFGGTFVYDALVLETGITRCVLSINGSQNFQLSPNANCTGADFTNVNTLVKTASLGTNTTTAASTAFVQAAIAAKSSSVAEIRIPFVLQSSGTMGNNGALSGITALEATYSSGAYLYFGANVICSGSAAGWYYSVGSSATAFTVFNNIYTSGVPAIPGSPTAFSCSGPGAYTQTTSSQPAISLTVPGAVMGSIGRLILDAVESHPSNGNAKVIGASFGGTALFNFQPSTGNATTFRWTITNTATSSQIADIVPDGSTAGFMLLHAAVNTANPQTYLLSLQLGNAADYIVLQSMTLTAQP